jgi:hypothetical protein
MKQYFITAMECLHRNVFVNPDDERFTALMTEYEKLKKQHHKESDEWLVKARKLNAEFHSFVKELFAEPPFELPEPPCGIEVYSVEELDEPSVGWKHPSLVGLEFTREPFDDIDM